VLNFFILQPSFLSAQHLYEKREGCGAGRIRIHTSDKKHAELVPDPDPQHWFIFFTGPPEGTAGEKEVHPWGLNTLPGGTEAPYWGPEAPTAPPPKRMASPSSEFYRMDLLARLCS
jgi:hypothetical protein